MAKYEGGFLGPYSGLLGDGVGASFRGANIVRRRPRKSKKQPTELQLAQRIRFAKVMQFLTPANLVLSTYFGKQTGTKSRFNLATAYHLKEAVAYDGTEASILYDKCLFSKGALLPPQNLTAVVAPNAELQLSWVSNPYGNAKVDDQLVVVVHETQLAGLFEVYYNAGLRQDATATVVVPNFMLGNPVHVWAFMVSADKKLVSTSQYLGAFTVL